MADDIAPLLEVTGLSVAYAARSRRERREGADVVHGVSLSLRHGETLALVGESGSGKSTIARAVSGLLPAGARVTGGRVRLDGRVVSGLSAREWRPLRGRTVGYVPQDPLSSLDPLQRVGAQIVEAVRAVDRRTSRDAARRRAIELLDRVGIPDPEARLRSYPHELSGGQLQRVLIAIAIAADPVFLIADEPTSALDVTVQKRILDLLDDLRREHGLGVLFITHDLALAYERSDHVAVLRGGVLLEHRAVAHMLLAPEHEYTARLLADVPASAPHKYAQRGAPSASTDETIVLVRDVHKAFPPRTPRERPVVALESVSLDVRAGSVHAIVGESGSGKTTLARIVAGLSPFSRGEVVVRGRALSPAGARFNAHPEDLLLVYQNALAALDPRFTVERIVAEPLELAHAGGRAERRRRVREALDSVALPHALLHRRPIELSGGQRQRVALARSMVLAPRVLVLDEPTSALDVSVQSRIVELLFDLRRERELTYLFISHDLGLVRQIADHVSVLQNGVLVESAPAAALFDAPRHEYTRRLLDAVPGQGLFDGHGEARSA